MCVRLLRPYEMKTGAHVKPVIEPLLTSRLYELTVGHATAQIAGACASTPATKLYASGEMPAPRGSSSAAKRFSPVDASASDMLKWPPLPVRSPYGFAMKVACTLCRRATSLVISLQRMNRSHIVSASEYEKSNSNWLFASSWTNECTSQPR